MLRLLITLVMALSSWIVTAIVLMSGWPVEEGGTFGHIAAVSTIVAIGVGMALWKSDTKPELDKSE
jgi:hypothetical protein